LISRIPGIGGRYSGIGAGRQVAIQVIGLGGGAEGELLVIVIVVGRGQGGWEVGPREGPPRLNPITGCIIGIEQRPQGGDRGVGMSWCSLVRLVLPLVRIRILVRKS